MNISAGCQFLEMLKKSASDNPDLPIEFIKDILIAKYQDASLAESFNF